MTIIAITGTPGTGKTQLAQELAKSMKYSYINLTDFITNNNIAESYDKKRRCLVIDPKLLIKKLKPTLKGNVIIDSHLSHEYPELDLCIVCKCELKELKKRLKERGYDKAKIEENLESEIFDVCLTEAIEEHNHPVLIVKTDGKIDIADLKQKIKEHVKRT